jgi:hypothetical protein
MARKLLGIAITVALLCMPTCTFAALSAATVWDVRSTGSQTNGGGYHTTAGSTDYSQQDSAQWSGTDLACADHSDPYNVTSATASFTDLIEGNIIYISDTGTGEHFVVGWYEVTGYVDEHTIQLDRDPTDGSDDVAGDFAIGGAFKIGGSLDASFFASLVAGNTVYVEKGTYTFAQNITAGTAATAQANISVIGYTSTHGDVCEGADLPLFVCSTYEFSTGAYYYLANFSYTVSSALGFTPGSASMLRNVHGLNGSGTAGRSAIQTSGVMSIVECSFASTAGVAIHAAGTATIDTCYIHDSVTGIDFLGSTNYIYNNVFDTCSSYGINMGARTGLIIKGNTIFGCGVGLYSSATAGMNQIVNNVIDSCTTGASLNAVLASNRSDYNYWNNTTNLSNLTEGSHDVLITPYSATVLTDPANGTPSAQDFTLQSTTTGAIGSGLTISAVHGISGVYAWNMGVDQSDHDSGSSSVTTPAFDPAFE